MAYWEVCLAEYCMNRNANDPCVYPAQLTVAGENKLLKLKQGKSPEMIAGIDYRIRETDSLKNDVKVKLPWIGLEENTFTEEYRHDWVFKRHQRPKDPSFVHCPMPRRGENQQEKNAALIMTYFHPFTLNPANGDEHVPFLGNLCDAGLTWHNSLLKWFDGNILCEEVKRYIQNFLIVTRTRPSDEQDVHSDDQFSDEELVVNSSNFRDIVKTRIASGPKRDAEEKKDEQTQKSEASAEAAFEKARDMWIISDSAETVMTSEGETIMTSEEVKKTLAAAQSSQKQADVGSALPSSRSCDPTVRKKKATLKLTSGLGTSRSRVAGMIKTSLL